MSHQIRQSEAALSNAATRVADCKRDLLQFSHQLDGQLQGLRSQWQGQGGTAFMKLHQAWDERQRQITSALDRFEESLITTEKDNVATDDAASSALHKIAARLS